MKKRFLIPLALFAVLAVFLGIGLNRDPSEVPSPLIGKLAPVFTLSQLHDDTKPFSPKDMVGQVWLLNVWASWCRSCREEHPMLLAFAKTKIAPLIGLNCWDKPPAAMGWLRRLGDPYVLNAVDTDGRVGIDCGVYGARKTYVINKEGVIRFRQIGPVTNEVLQQKILPLVKELQK